MQVFISYSRKDTNIAEKLEHDLRKYGYKPLRDVNLSPVPFEEQIKKWIRKSRVVVVLVSPNAVVSDWVKKEIISAKAHGKQIIPISINGAKHPELLHINHFDGSSYDYALHRTLDFLRELWWRDVLLRSAVVFVLGILIVAAYFAFLRGKEDPIIDTPTPTTEATIIETEAFTETPSFTPTEESSSTVSTTPSDTPTTTETKTSTPTFTTPPTETSTAEVSVEASPIVVDSTVKMVLYYLDNGHLGLRFDTSVPQRIWLYGLSFSWTDTTGTSHTLSISDFPLDTALEGLTSDQCIEFYVASPAGNVPGCTVSGTLSVPLTDTSNRFWLGENAVFSVLRGQQTLNACSTILEATCTISWTNSPDNLLLAPTEMIMEWADEQMLFIHFDTVSPTINLSSFRFSISTGAGIRYYQLKNFDELVSQVNIAEFPSSACIILGSNPNVEHPQTVVGCRTFYYDSVGVAEMGSAFWIQEVFGVSYHGQNNLDDIPLGVCPTRGYTSCTIHVQ